MSDFESLIGAHLAQIALPVEQLAEGEAILAQLISYTMLPFVKLTRNAPTWSDTGSILIEPLGAEAFTVGDCQELHRIFGEAVTKLPTARFVRLLYSFRKTPLKADDFKVTPMINLFPSPYRDAPVSHTLQAFTKIATLLDLPPDFIEKLTVMSLPNAQSALLSAITDCIAAYTDMLTQAVSDDHQEDSAAVIAALQSILTDLESTAKSIRGIDVSRIPKRGL